MIQFDSLSIYIIYVYIHEILSNKNMQYVVPQIALAIGVLTSNSRGGADQTFGEVVVAAVPGCHCWVPLVDQTFGKVVVAAVPGRHCGCRSWVPLLGGAPLLGAIGGSIGSDFWRGCCCCRSWVPLVGAIGTQLWRGCRSCHSWVPLLLLFLGAIGRWRMGRGCRSCRSWVPLLGAIGGCHWDATLARLS